MSFGIFCDTVVALVRWRSSVLTYLVSTGRQAGGVRPRVSAIVRMYEATLPQHNPISCMFISFIVLVNSAISLREHCQAIKLSGKANSPMNKECNTLSWIQSFLICMRQDYAANVKLFVIQKFYFNSPENVGPFHQISLQQIAVKLLNLSLECDSYERCLND